MAKVYIKIDKNNCITGVESDLTLKDATEYVQIDEGNGDKYVHAQNNYFPKEKPLRDIRGRCNYKYIDSKVIELTEEEKGSLFPVQEEIKVSNEERLQALEDALIALI